MSVLGIGTDVVAIEPFAEQLADAASGFVGATFTAAEQAAAQSRPGPDAVHLAGRFAAKEAFLKAWSAARTGLAPTAAAVDLREIEILSDDFGRPLVRLRGEVAGAVAALAPDAQLHHHLSLSHDGPVATAFVVLEARPPSRG